MNAQDLKLDYFKFYDVYNYRVDYRVALHGQFDEEPEQAELLLLSYFGNPVSKNQEPIYNRNAHLTWYQLYQPIPEPTRTVVIKNQFGQQEIVIGRPFALLAPALKQERGSQFPVKLDHFKLYKVLEGQPVDQSVALQDQFSSDEVRIICPIAFGVPVKKQYQEHEAPLYNPDAHLLIYRITPRSVQQARPVRDQFGKRFLSFLRSVALAVPSVKLEWNEMD